MRLFILAYVILFALPLWANDDSLRIESIKGLRFIIYKIDKQDDLRLIAQRFGVTINDILTTNQINQSEIKKDDLIKIPLLNTEKKDTNKVDEAHANAQSQEITKTIYHTVQQGDNIKSLAKKYRLTEAQLTKWNNLKNGKLLNGQLLIVDESALAKPYFRINGPESAWPNPNNTVRKTQDSIYVQTGMAVFEEEFQVLHPTLPLGTLIRVINTTNNKECIVRVTGKLDAEKYPSILITIGKENQSQLEVSSAAIQVKILYSKQ
ncbi:MAG: LysM peptidoglycan-binding domain-containing protein [Bacteroidota bacterium]